LVLCQLRNTRSCQFGRRVDHNGNGQLSPETSFLGLVLLDQADGRENLGKRRKEEEERKSEREEGGTTGTQRVIVYFCVNLATLGAI